ncbi:MAG: flagellar hook-length control protein FliK [Alphaproteobacteria bacterium]
MEISALDRANTDRSTAPAPLAGAGGDMFDQLLASLTEVADPYGEDEPADDDTPEEKSENQTSATGEATKHPYQELAVLGQTPTGQKLVQNNIPETTPEIENTDSDVTAPAIAPAIAHATETAPAIALASADVTETSTIVAKSPEAAAIVQPMNASQHRATPQTGDTQSSQHQATKLTDLEAGKVSLRAGRGEAMQQGTGQFHTPGANALAGDKAALTSPTSEQSSTQPNRHAEQLAPTGHASQLAAQPENPALEIPKSMAPVPPAPIAAVNAPTTNAPPSTNAPIEQTTQLAAGARTGAAQSIEGARQPSANRQAAASRHLQPAQQIAVHIRNGLKAGADSIHVRLHPEELGRVEVRMQIDGDKNVQAVITVEKAEALELLQRDSRVLQRALEEAGFKASHDSFTFEHNQSAPNQGDKTPGERHIAAGDDGDATNDASDQEAANLANSRSSHDGLVDIEV